jgi:NADH:ubiquinone oxidoreductase subunit 6 (subunit J)
VVDLDPFLRWSLAIIAGGGSAAIVQGGTVLTRAASTGTTGGLANFVVSTFETVAGTVFSVLSLVFPILALILLAALIGIMYFIGRRVLNKLLARHA